MSRELNVLAVTTEPPVQFGAADGRANQLNTIQINGTSGIQYIMLIYYAYTIQYTHVLITQNNEISMFFYFRKHKKYIDTYIFIFHSLTRVLNTIIT